MRGTKRYRDGRMAGTCHHCRRQVRLREDGTTVLHAVRGAQCPGSHEPHLVTGVSV